MLSHTASHMACPSYASMVSHVHFNSNVVHTSNHVPGKPPVDLWQHLVEISRCSFYRAHKRKRQADAVGALCDALQSLDSGSSLCARFKRVCLDGSECDVPRPDTDKTYVVNGMLEALENSSEKSEEQRRLEDLEFERLSQTVNLFGCEDNGKEEASSADSYYVDVSQHALQ